MQIRIRSTSSPPFSRCSLSAEACWPIEIGTQRGELQLTGVTLHEPKRRVTEKTYSNSCQHERAPLHNQSHNLICKSTNLTAAVVNLSRFGLDLGVCRQQQKAMFGGRHLLLGAQLQGAVIDTKTAHRSGGPADRRGQLARQSARLWCTRSGSFLVAMEGSPGVAFLAFCTTRQFYLEAIGDLFPFMRWRGNNEKCKAWEGRRRVNMSYTVIYVYTIQYSI